MVFVVSWNSLVNWISWSLRLACWSFGVEQSDWLLAQDVHWCGRCLHQRHRHDSTSEGELIAYEWLGKLEALADIGAGKCVLNGLSFADVNEHFF